MNDRRLDAFGGGPDPETYDRLRARYLELTEEVLPQLADREDGWPVRFDHCFQRIVLDNVAGDEWYGEVADPDADRPAYQQLSAAELREAIEIAEKMVAEGPDACRRLNQRSLEYRGHD